MINVYWDNPEQTIVRLDYSDPVKSWEEYQEAIKKANEMISSKKYTVHAIHNPGKTRMPPGNPLFHITRALRSVPGNGGHVLMVVENMFARRVIETILQLIISKNAGFAASVEAARERIKSSNTASA